MRPTQAGAHCSRCDKNVVDISKMTQLEAVKLVESSQGDLCVNGMFDRERETFVHQPERKRTRLPVLQTFALAATVALAACGGGGKRSPKGDSTHGAKVDAPHKPGSIGDGEIVGNKPDITDGDEGSYKPTPPISKPDNTPRYIRYGGAVSLINDPHDQS